MSSKTVKKSAEMNELKLTVPEYQQLHEALDPSKAGIIVEICTCNSTTDLAMTVLSSQRLRAVNHTSNYYQLNKDEPYTVCELRNKHPISRLVIGDEVLVVALKSKPEVSERAFLGRWRVLDRS